MSAWKHPPRVRRSLIAGFYWPLFGALVLVGIVFWSFALALDTTWIDELPIVEATLCPTPAC